MPAPRPRVEVLDPLLVTKRGGLPEQGSGGRFMLCDLTECAIVRLGFSKGAWNCAFSLCSHQKVMCISGDRDTGRALFGAQGMSHLMHRKCSAIVTNTFSKYVEAEPPAHQDRDRRAIATEQRAGYQRSRSTGGCYNLRVIATPGGPAAQTNAT